jgi:hypothetical protein
VFGCSAESCVLVNWFMRMPHPWGGGGKVGTKGLFVYKRGGSDFCFFGFLLLKIYGAVSWGPMFV